MTGSENKRIAVVGSELLGRPGTGGAGTADSLLAVALGRHGHHVDLVVASGRDIGELTPEWTRNYDAAGVRVHILQPLSTVTPSYLAPTLEVFHALRELQPDVAIVNDWRGLGWAAMRARAGGLDLAQTAFIVHCHGPGRVLTEFAGKVPDTLERFGEHVIERASFELADAIVSPSQWLVEWLRSHRWPLHPPVRVIQYIRQSVALGGEPAGAVEDGSINRLAFFGQLREGKGIRLYLAAVNALRSELVEGTELLFLGSESKRWPSQRIIGALRPPLRAAARVEPRLTREAALDELRRPGTLAVMPSVLDNSPNTVSECVELGIPFISTNTGGIAELVAAEDRARVLCPPTAEGLTEALTRVLSDSSFARARPAHEPSESLRAWLELVEEMESAAPPANREAVGVALVASGPQSLRHATRLAEQSTSVEAEVVQADSRPAGLSRTAAEWVVFLDEDDDPDDTLLDALAAVQAATGADVVTAAVRCGDDPNAIRLFLGNPGALGLVENQYGVIGLARSSLAADCLGESDAVDPDWPFFARLVLRGARVAAIPVPLSRLHGAPGKVTDLPGAGLAVLEAFEAEDMFDLDGVPQLAATLAAALDRLQSVTARTATGDTTRGILRRVVRKVAR
jgi:glycosyltransferase involved in cell wall biosynthesis